MSLCKQNSLPIPIVTQSIILPFNISLSFCTRAPEGCLTGPSVPEGFYWTCVFPAEMPPSQSWLQMQVMCRPAVLEAQTYHVTRGSGQPATEQWNLTFCFSQTVWERGSITNSGACRSLSWFNFLRNAWVSSSWKRNTGLETPAVITAGW